MATQAKTKSVQIRLNPNNARDKQVLDYLEMMGRNSGEAKRIFLDGFFGANKGVIIAPEKAPAPKKKVENVCLDSMIG